MSIDAAEDELGHALRGSIARCFVASLRLDNSSGRTPASSEWGLTRVNRWIRCFRSWAGWCRMC
jgi:hypothetical protein